MEIELSRRQYNLGKEILHRTYEPMLLRKPAVVPYDKGRE
jgi:hypothetical protein